MKNLSESILHELIESANVDVNNLTKEQLWKLRQEIVLGSLYTHDYDNSFGIDPSAVCNFFDSFIEDAQTDDYGKPNDRETKDYDNAEDLYDYYRSCENPFGEIDNINESSNKRKLKEDVDWSKELDRKVIEAKTEEPMNESSITSEDISTSLNNLIDKYDSLSAETQVDTKDFVYQRIFFYKGIENKNVEFIITVGKDSTIYVRILRGYSLFSPISDDFLSIMKDIKDIFSSYTLI